MIPTRLAESRRRGLFALSAALLIASGLVLVAPSGAEPVAGAVAAAQTPERCPDAVSLDNGGFEQPVITARTFRFLPSSSVPGWDTTASDSTVELWSAGFNGVPAHSGSQFAELNANEPSALYQTIATVPGLTLTWSLAHRGRAGTDTMAVDIGPPGGPFATVATVSDGAAAWGVHQGRYTVPAGQYETTMRFRAVSTAGGNPSVGNFLDSIVLGTEACIVATESVSNLSRTSGRAQVGDTLAYTLTVVNQGGASATALSVEDEIPAGTTYVPGSLTVVSSPTPSQAGGKSDAVDGDVGSVSSGVVRVNLGSGARANAGGSILPGEAASIGFRVRIAPSAASGTVVDQGAADYVGETARRATTNEVSTSVAPAADLAVAATSTPAVAVAGEDVTHTLSVLNNGPDGATGVVLTETLPDGVSVVSSPPGCTRSGRVVSCAVGSLPASASISTQLVLRVPTTATAALVGTVGVTSTTSDFAAGNDSASVQTGVSTRADVAIAKTVTPTASVAGRTVTYRLDVTNAGPSAAASVRVEDALPDGLSLDSATSSSGTCTSAGSTLECRLGTVDVGETPSVVVVARVAPGAAAGPLPNTGSVSAATADPDLSDNTSQALTTVSRSADLSVSMSAPTTTTAGRRLTVTTVVANDGPSSATGVVVEDPASSGLTLVSAASSQGSCDQATTCTLGEIAAGAQVRITRTYDVAPERLTPVQDAVTATGTTPDPDAEDLGASTTVPVVASADLGLSASQDPATITFGAPVDYELTVHNAGPSTATDVVVTDPVPPGLTFASSPDGCSVTAGTVRCAVGTLAPGSSATVSFRAETPSGGSGVVRNTATVESSTPDPVAADNTATSESSGVARADLRIRTSTQTATPTAGRPIAYAVVVDNLGPSAASDTTVTDTLPAGVAFDAASSSAGCTAAAGGVVTCALGALASGASRAVTIGGTVAPSARGLATNRATVSADVEDPSPGNNEAQSATTIAGEADLEAAIVPAMRTSVAGTIETFALVVRNAGPSTAEDVVITGQVPEGMTPVIGSSGGICTVSDRTLTCALGTVGAGVTLPTIPLRARIDATVAEGATLVGGGQARSSTPDPDQDDNAPAATVQVTTSADLRTVASVAPASVVAGGPAVYTLRVVNDGPSQASGVVLTDTLPAGFTATSAAGSGAACTLGAGTVSCPIGTVPVGAAAEVRVIGRFSAAVSGTVTNRARVTSATTDPDGTDDEDVLTSPVVTEADLRVSLDAPAAVVAGQRATYTLAVVNAGPSDATAVELEHELPAEVDVDELVVHASTGTCAVAGQGLGCDLGTLASGAAAVVTVQGPVDAATPQGAVLVSRARVSSPVVGPATDRLTPDRSTVVATLADVGVDLVPVGSPVAGGILTYRLVVTNSGPSTARDVVVRQPVPARTALVDAHPSLGVPCDTADGVVRCAFSRLDHGEVVVLVVRVRVAPDGFGAPLDGVATVTTGTADLDSANDTRESTVVPSEAAGLSVSAAAVGDVVAGGTVDVRAVLTNAGPSHARQPVLTGEVPEGATLVSATADGDGSCSATASEVACRWTAAPTGATRSAVLRFALDDDLADGTELEPVVSATSQTPSPAATAAARMVVGTSAALSLTREVPVQAVAGERVAWRTTLLNQGPSRLHGITLRDPLPTGLRDVVVEAAPGADCRVLADAVACTVADLAAGAPVPVVVSARVDAARRGLLTGTAVAAGTAASGLVSSAEAAGSTEVHGRATVTVRLRSSERRVEVGDVVVQTVRVRASGPSTATRVRVLTAVPDGLVLTSASASAGRMRGERWTVGRLAPGATATLRLRARVAADADRRLVSRATVSAAEDPAPGADGRARNAVVVTDRPVRQRDGDDERSDRSGEGEDDRTDPSVEDEQSPDADEDGTEVVGTAGTDDRHTPGVDVLPDAGAAVSLSLLLAGLGSLAGGTALLGASRPVRRRPARGRPGRHRAARAPSRRARRFETRGGTLGA